LPILAPEVGGERGFDPVKWQQAIAADFSGIKIGGSADEASFKRKYL
jgi:hypothetical protein